MKFIIIIMTFGGIQAINLDLMYKLIAEPPTALYKLPNPKEAIMDSLLLFPKLELSNFHKELIWSLYKGNTHPAELTASNLSEIMVLIPMMPEYDLYRLNITDWNIVKILASVTQFTRRQVVVITNALKYEYGWKKLSQATYLNQMSGLICGLSIYDLLSIKEKEFEKIDNQVFRHLYTCTNSQLELLYKKVVHDYGTPQCWTDKTVAFVGFIPLSMKEDDIQSIRNKAMKGMNVEMLIQRKEEMISMFTEEQIDHMSLAARMFIHVNSSFLLPKSSALPTLNNIYLTLGLFLKAYLLLIF